MNVHYVAKYQKMVKNYGTWEMKYGAKNVVIGKKENHKVRRNKMYISYRCVCGYEWEDLEYHGNLQDECPFCGSEEIEAIDEDGGEV